MPAVLVTDSVTLPPAQKETGPDAEMDWLIPPYERSSKGINTR